MGGCDDFLYEFWYVGDCDYFCVFVVAVMIFVYEFWYVGGACGLMMCWCDVVLPLMIF